MEREWEGRGRKEGRKRSCSVYSIRLNFFASACRETTLVVYVMTLVGMVVYTFTLNLGYLWVVFITAGAMG